MHPANAICHANGGNSFLASTESAVSLAYMWRREMKRLDLHLHLSLTFCHKYAVCQISYARKEKEHQEALPQLLHGATPSRAKASRPRAGRMFQQVLNRTSSLNWKIGKVDISDISNFFCFFEELRLFLILRAFQMSPTVHFFVQPQSIKSKCRQAWKKYTQHFQNCLPTDTL